MNAKKNKKLQIIIKYQDVPVCVQDTPVTAVATGRQLSRPVVAGARAFSLARASRSAGLPLISAGLFMRNSLDPCRF